MTMEKILVNFEQQTATVEFGLVTSSATTNKDKHSLVTKPRTKAFPHTELGVPVVICIENVYICKT